MSPRMLYGQHYCLVCPYCTNHDILLRGVCAICRDCHHKWVEHYVSRKKLLTEQHWAQLTAVIQF